VFVENYYHEWLGVGGSVDQTSGFQLSTPVQQWTESSFARLCLCASDASIYHLRNTFLVFEAFEKRE
jgi:hypothetical protein